MWLDAWPATDTAPWCSEFCPNWGQVVCAPAASAVARSTMKKTNVLLLMDRFSFFERRWKAPDGPHGPAPGRNHSSYSRFTAAGGRRGGAVHDRSRLLFASCRVTPGVGHLERAA